MIDPISVNNEMTISRGFVTFVVCSVPHECLAVSELSLFVIQFLDKWRRQAQVILFLEYLC